MSPKWSVISYKIYFNVWIKFLNFQVIKCLKELSIKQNISIISTIHQPNSDVLQMFDNLYVLAKGGVCVYSGSPQHLPNHLRECNIVCNENQVPIETLITIGSKDFDDNRIVELKNKTTSKTMESIQRILNETKTKLIKHQNKRFHFKDIYLLLERGITEFIAYNYKRFSLEFGLILS